MPRLFTGLEVPPDVAASLAGARNGLPDARWIDPADYHVTLRFIGDVDGPTARDIVAGLAESSPRAATPITFDRLDSFGRDRPRAVIARAAPSADLLRLQAEHERLMQDLGLAPEPRRYAPHVTLARLRGISSVEVAAYLARTPLRPLAFTPVRVALFSARASVGGGPYVVEAAFPLG